MKNQTLYYSVIITLSPFFFYQFELKIEHGKSEIFHFSRLTRNFNSSFLDLSLLEKSLL